MQMKDCTKSVKHMIAIYQCSRLHSVCYTREILRSIAGVAKIRPQQHSDLCCAKTVATLGVILPMLAIVLGHFSCHGHRRRRRFYPVTFLYRELL